MKKLLLLLVMLWGPAAWAGDAVYTGFFSNKAVSGYDTVAYFTEGKPVKGNKSFTTEYQGAEWYFASQANLDAFVADPGRYAPQFGGFCAWAIAVKQSRASGDPKNWSIVDGKLYLNYDDDIQALWQADQAQMIANGHKHWPAVLAN